MYNYLYQKYKNEMIDTGITNVFKKTNKYERIALLSLLLGVVGFLISFLFKLYILGMVFYAIIIATAMISMIRDKSKKIKIQYTEEIIKPNAYARIERMVGLLRKPEIDIDVTDKNQLEDVISLAKKERDLYLADNRTKAIFSGVWSSIVVPTISILLSKFLAEIDFKRIIVCIILSVLMFFAGYMVSEFKTSLNTEIRDLNCFIRDLENVKVFYQKTKSVLMEMEKNNLEIVENQSE